MSRGRKSVVATSQIPKRQRRLPREREKPNPCFTLINKVPEDVGFRHGRSNAAVVFVRIVCLTSVLGWAGLAYAQAPALKFTQISIEEGLSQLSINAILQDF